MHRSLGVTIGVLLTMLAGVHSASAGPLNLVSITIPAVVPCTSTPTPGSVTWTNPYGVTIYIKASRLFAYTYNTIAQVDVTLNRLTGLVPIHGMSWRLGGTTAGSVIADDKTTHTPDYFELGPGQSLLLYHQCTLVGGASSGSYNVSAQIYITVGGL